MKKKITLGALIIVILLTIFIFDKKVWYKEVPLEQTIYDIHKDKGVNEGNYAGPTVGVSQGGAVNYASIYPLKGERVEIISVQKSENVGIDVLYRIVKLPDNNAQPEGRSVKFINLFGSPVGFVQK
jgi:hypothetical protein